jgi:membrane protease YdiL (CAAX protease family)
VTSSSAVAPNAPAGWRESRALAAAELALVVAIVLIYRRGWLPVSSTLYLLPLGWISLRLRGRRWRDVGLAPPASWTRAILVGTVAGLAMEVFSTWVTVPFLSRLTGQPPDLSDFRPLVGNLRLVLIWILPLWLGSFAEELVHRGYLLNRVADLLGRDRWAWFAALIVVSAGFGLTHVDQGVTGWVQEGFAGLLLGALYLASGRNLVVPTVAHCVSNTLAFVLIYLDRYPGV